MKSYKYMFLENNLTPTDVIKSVSEVTGISVENIVMPDKITGARKREYVTARHLALTYMKKNIKISLASMGKSVNRDHATVLSAEKNIQDLIETDKDMKKLYGMVVSTCNARNNQFKEHIKKSTEDYLAKNLGPYVKSMNVIVEWTHINGRTESLTFKKEKINIALKIISLLSNKKINSYATIRKNQRKPVSPIRNKKVCAVRRYKASTVL